jgi:hypothetical protein
MVLILPMSSYVIPAIRLTGHICTCIPFLVDKFYMYTLCTYNESSFFPVCIPSQKQSEVILKDTCAYQNLYSGHTLIQWVGWIHVYSLATKEHRTITVLLSCII